MSVSALDPLAAMSWLQLQDSAFPSGRFVHSHGLEGWLGAHPEATAEDVTTVCRSYLARGVMPVDGVASVWAWHLASDGLPGQRLAELDEHVTTYKLSTSARTASTRTGQQLAGVARKVHPSLHAVDYLREVAAGKTPGHAAVVEGTISRTLHLPLAACVAGLLRSTYSQLFSAAVRLGRIGPIFAQQALARDALFLIDLTASAIEEAGPVTPTGPLPALHASTPELEIHAMRHERVTTRLFAT